MASKQNASKRKTTKKAEAQSAPQPGRPTKLNAQTQKKICDAILVGATYEAAAVYAGISYDTFNEWMKAGRAAKEPDAFSEFSDAVAQANAAAQVYFATNIKTSAQGGEWRAAAWMLERRFPKDYGAVTKSEITGAGGGPVQVEDINVTRQKRWEQFAPALAAALTDENEQTNDGVEGAENG